MVWMMSFNKNPGQQTIFRIFVSCFFLTLLAFVFGFGDTEIGGLHWNCVSSLASF